MVKITERSEMTTFSAAYPSYAATAVLDDLRAREYARLDRGGHAYLDYTAGNLYAISQVERHMALLRDHVFGNPHSTNPTSSLTMELDGRARVVGRIVEQRFETLETSIAAPEEAEGVEHRARRVAPHPG